MRGAFISAVWSLVIFGTAGASGADTESELQVTGIIRRTIESALDGNSFTCGGEVLCGAAVIPSFYERRRFRPAWVHEGALQPQAKALISTLYAAVDEGLEPRDYHLERLQQLIAERSGGGPADPATLAHLDIFLTDAFLMYAAHMLGGRVNPETVHAQWSLPARKASDLGGILERFLASADQQGVLASFPPPYEGYALLRDSLRRYKALVEAGGWNAIPPGPALRKGDWGSRVVLLRQRLEASGDLAPGGRLTDEFGAEVERAVKRFQSRHGLEVDGIAGRETLAAMNIPVQARVRQIRFNLERWRWLSRYPENPHVLVNIADYSLAVVEDGRHVIRMKAVVGRDYRRTPVFSDRIRYLVFNPSWVVPTSIAVKDILPKVKKDPGYLERERIRVFRGWGEDSPEVDGRLVDWSGVGRRNFPYSLRQDPGPHNALGRINFMFPNKFAVYLHDTNDTGVFEKTERPFSSGCIRIEEPIVLAAYLLKNQGWTAERIEKTLSTAQTRTVMLARPVAVHIQYWTAWVDEAMTVHFRKDIYDRDDPLGRALDERPPRLLEHFVRCPPSPAPPE